MIDHPPTNGTRPEYDVLDLDALAPQGLPVKVDGQLYHTVPAESIGMRQIATIKRHFRAVQKANDVITTKLKSDDEDPTDKDVDAYEAAVADLGQMLIPEMPKKVAVTLDEWQWGKIIEAFTTVAFQRKSEPTSENSSPDSADSSVEATANGKS